MEGVVREPIVAGYFYEGDSKKLREQIKWSFLHNLGPRKLPEPIDSKERISIGYISPHAGYIYSGPIAAHTYFALSQEKKPDTIVIIGPNHTGLGKPVALAPWKTWKTPLGKINVDIILRNYLIKNSEIIFPDYKAHIQEHSIEVQIPFIQFIYGEQVQILPISVLDQTPEVASQIAEELYTAIRETNRDVIVIASSDMNHYDPHNVTLEKDMEAIRALMEMNPEKFYDTIVSNNISVCGPAGIMVLMYLSKKKNGKKPIVLKHATSGDTSGDKSAVVGYLAAVSPL